MLESRRGSTGHQNNPWFAIKRASRTKNTATSGSAHSRGAAPGASPSSRTNSTPVRVTGGYNPFDFGYVLAPGEKLDTPVFYGGYSAHGMGEASRILHRFELDQHLPRQRPAIRPSCAPSSTTRGKRPRFNVDEAGQVALAEKAASIGIERFVMDDGWFGQRKDDHAGLGDWYVNPQKFPNGLKPLIDKVHALGMDFGLWVEPEMVNPDSDLYRKHPDWVINFPGRPRTEGRNQLVLNLARPDVRDYVFDFLDKLLTENEIAFLKWDYNRNWSEPGWDQLPPEEQKKVYVEFTQNLYSILAELRAKHPEGRDRVLLRRRRPRRSRHPAATPTKSGPPTTPIPSIASLIQDGFTYAYTPQVMMAWVTDSPHWLNKRTPPSSTASSPPCRARSASAPISRNGTPTTSPQQSA